MMTLEDEIRKVLAARIKRFSDRDVAELTRALNALADLFLDWQLSRALNDDSARQDAHSENRGS